MGERGRVARWETKSLALPRQAKMRKALRCHARLRCGKPCVVTPGYGELFGVEDVFGAVEEVGGLGDEEVPGLAVFAEGLGGLFAGLGDGEELIEVDGAVAEGVAVIGGEADAGVGDPPGLAVDGDGVDAGGDELVGAVADDIEAVGDGGARRRSCRGRGRPWR